MKYHENSNFSKFRGGNQPRKLEKKKQKRVIILVREREWSRAVFVK
jgi:hypothetical protein